MGPLSADGRLIPRGEGAVRAIHPLFRIRVCSCGRAGATSRTRSRCAPVQRRNGNDSRVLFATVRGPTVRHQRLNSATGGVQQYVLVQVLDPDDRFLSMEVFFTGEPHPPTQRVFHVA
jgi:hypothetical protein